MPLQLTQRLKITPASTSKKFLNVKHYKQEQSNWCWAACCQMVFDYFGFIISQCNIANYYFKGQCCKKPSKCNQGLTPSEISALYNHWSYKYSYQASQIAFIGIQASIDSNKLIEVALYWKGGGGHVVVVNGWSTGSQDEVYVNDPGYGSGPGWITYSELEHAYGKGTWGGTWNSLTK